MKISPATGGNTPGQALGTADVGRTADAGKVARAIAVAQGQTPPEAAPATQAERPNVRALKMRTNYSTDRDLTPAVEQVTTESAPAMTESSMPDKVEGAAVEATQPLSPQLAALAKEKRALQLQRAELEKAKAELDALKGSNAPNLEQELKSNPLGTLQKLGITYDQLTEAVLQDPQNLELEKLRQEIAQIKDGFNKTLAERDNLAKEQVKREIAMDAQRLAAEGSDYELVRETGSVPMVVELIERYFNETGEVMNTEEALSLIETELVEEASKIAGLSKVRGKIAPQATAPQLQPAQKQMRTLTSRDNATQALTARQRAIAAFNGTLKR